MHEIVTIQIGEQANYLGTHFWNVQESYFTYDSRHESPVDHNVHFQAGIGAGGVDTFTPRTLIYDFKRNFGTLRKVNELYDALGQDDADPASGSAISHRQPPIPMHPYQRALNEGSDPPILHAQGIRFWSDFNRVFYNPRSIAQIYEDQLEPQQKAFSQWQDGEALFDSLSRHTDLLDEELRPLIEQCDQMQGLQLLTGVDDGWGGFGARYLDALRDDYDKSTIIVHGLNGATPDTSLRRTLSMSNQARSLYAITSQASVYVPLTAAFDCVPKVFSAPSIRPWFTSAMQTIGFESVFLQTRLRGTMIRMAEMSQILTAEPGQQIAEADFKLLDAQEYAPNGTNGHTYHGLGETANTCRLQPHVEDQAIQLDGLIELLRGRDVQEDATGKAEEPGEERLTQSLRNYADIPFPILDSFPGVTEGARSFKVHARLGKSSSVSTWAADLQRVASRAIGIEDREELLDGLSHIRAAYEAQPLSDDSADDN